MLSQNDNIRKVSLQYSTISYDFERLLRVNQD